MTTKGEWVAYTGSDEQIAEILDQDKTAYIVKWDNGKESEILGEGDHDLMYDYGKPTHYWIIPDDPLREMKVRQAQTGQPVWVRYMCNLASYQVVIVTTTPNWNIPNAEYSFTAFKE